MNEQSSWMMVPYNPFSLMENEFYGAVPRDSKWQALRSKFIRQNPICAACGVKTNLEVHHIRPFEYWNELELDENNLVTLCMSEKHNCHLIFGHLFNWCQYNPDIKHTLSLLNNRKRFIGCNEEFFREYNKEN